MEQADANQSRIHGCEEQALASPPLRDFRCSHTQNFASILQQLEITLLVSSYHSGELIAVAAGAGRLGLSFHHFERAMGIAVRNDKFAVGTRTAVWTLTRDDGFAARILPKGRYDSCFLTTSAQFTGEIQSHELAWSGDTLWAVNTRFSCLCTFDDRHSFVPRWRPKFITALAAEDRCHLNGLAMESSRPRYVTALSETDHAEGWRPTKATSGCLIDVENDETVVRGLVMPHSPRIHEGRLWLLESGQGRFIQVDPTNGSTTTAAQLPGYTRGLAFLGPLAFIGLSKIRDSNTGMPIAAQGEKLQCGIAVVDISSGRQIALLSFQSGIEEIFDVQILPGVRSPLISGPNPHIDGRDVWLLP